VLGIDHVKIVASVEDIIYDPKGIIIEILSYPDKKTVVFIYLEVSSHSAITIEAQYGNRR
jgi:hypothetical protein